MKKSWITFLLILLLILLPAVTVMAVGFLVPSQFDNTFLGEFDNKVDRLYSTEGEKIVIVGGSSVAFGVDSKLLSETLGKPVINFGLYATLGTKTMLDFSENAIGEGDIVVIAPEMNAQTFSLYFNAESMWQAVDGHFSLLSHVKSSEVAPLMGSFWSFAASKLSYAVKGEYLNPDGIYNAASFDEYGFIRNRRDKDYNVMPGLVDRGMTIDFDTAMISPDFIDYVNAYTAKAESKGAKVYLSFCPMNEGALPADIEMEDLENYVAFLQENFTCDVLGDPNNMIYLPEYFYDSNFHLNSAGATVHTRQLAIDLAPLVGMTEEDITIEYPDPPVIPEEPDTPEILPYDENEVYFTFEITDFGVYLTGLTELGREQASLTVPKAYDGKAVTGMNEKIFTSSDKLTKLYIGENIGYIPYGVFIGADNLTEIHIAATNPETTRISNVDGMVGLPKGAKFYVPKAAYRDYTVNYFWGPYSDSIVAE